MSFKTMLRSLAVFVVIRKAICCQKDVRSNCKNENDCFYYPRHKIDCTVGCFSQAYTNCIKNCCKHCIHHI